jgi:hypothetical protein
MEECPQKRPVTSRKSTPLPYLDDIEDHVLVEAVQDALGHPVVAPSPMNQEQLLQVGKLTRESNKVQKEPVIQK